MSIIALGVLGSLAAGLMTAVVLSIETLRYQAKQETHLVFDFTSSELAAAPQMENADRVDRNWLDAVRSHYQLPV